MLQSVYTESASYFHAYISVCVISAVVATVYMSRYAKKEDIIALLDN